jgi:4-hydroxy-tetrahydrodipicolinate synthase
MTLMTRTAHHPTPGLRGAFTALVTPFTADGALDEAAYRRLVAWQVSAGIDGVVPVGTTGESPTLSQEERDRCIEIAVQTVAAHPSGGRIPVIAGTGSNDTRASIAATQRAAALGADAALIVTPYYNKPDQRMLEAHFRAIADDGALPIVVYNVPSRTGVNVEAATLLRLAEHPRILAVKEASANMDQIATILRERPAGFSVMAGDDVWTLPMLAMGGDGVICTCANEIPGEMAAMCAAALAGDWDTARRIHERWLPLMKANFVGGPNPVPVKAALSLMGLTTDIVRLPLLPLEESHRGRLRIVLETTGALELGGTAAAGSTGGAGGDGASGTTGSKRSTARLAIERATATAHA